MDKGCFHSLKLVRIEFALHILEIWLFFNDVIEPSSSILNNNNKVERMAMIRN